MAAPIETIRDLNSGRVLMIKVKLAAVKQASRRHAVSRNVARRAARKFIARHRRLMGLQAPVEQLDLPSTVVDELGFTHVRYRQLHRGILVIGAEVAVHLKPDGVVYFADSKTVDGLPDQITPSISRAQAVSIALASGQSESQGRFELYQSAAKLVVLPVDLLLGKAGGSNTRLAWEVTVGDLPRQERFSNKYYVDALSGDVIYSIFNIMTLNRKVYDCAAAPSDWTCRLDYASPLYSGYTFGRSEGQPARGASPNTGSFNFTALGNNYSYPYLGNSQADAAYSHYGAIQTLVAASFGLDGANNVGGTGCYPYVQPDTLVYVNQDQGAPYMSCPGGSASFNPSTGTINFCMRQTVPDIAGHEYGHALLQHLTRFKSGSWSFGPTYDGQSGSLQEAFSDFFGEVTENYITGSNNWRMGTTSFNWFTGQYDGEVRWMDAPQLSPWAPPDSFSYNCGGSTCYYAHPSRYFSAAHTCPAGTDYGDNHGVHRNSTIVSHALYKMAVGGNLYGCDVAPIGMEAVKQIYWRAWKVYFASTETFFQAYNHMQQACTDLYPAPSTVCDQVRTAMQGVQLDYPSCPTSSIPEPATTCAVRHVINAATYKPNFVNGIAYPSTRFAPGETMIVKGCGNMPNKTVRLSILPKSFTLFTNNVPQVIANNTWANTNYTELGSTDANGCFNMTFHNPLSVYQSYNDYFLIIDGGDALYEAYSDMALEVKIAAPVSGDGYCQVGQFTSSNEDCANAPVDCACASQYLCQSVNWNGIPRNMCIYQQEPYSS
ncbi:MAG: M4 family metallopeptidase [Oligoflexia bacterium]|nr:M4 family metallopeptidase [Oligoflexia bacterium]